MSSMAFTRNNLELLLAVITLVSIITESSQARESSHQPREPPQGSDIPRPLWHQIGGNINSLEFIKKYLKKKHNHGDEDTGWNPDDLLPGEPGISPDVVPPPDPNAPISGEQSLYTEEGTLVPGGAEVMAGQLSVQEDRCEIKMVSVPVPRSSDPNVIFWPSCVKLQQCSGCCNNEILQCVPSMESIASAQILRARYPHSGADYFEFEGVHNVDFRRHEACECRCRVQPIDCNPHIHDYDEHSCLCRCHNEANAMTCIHPKVWSNEKCMCVCPLYGRECYDDEEYDDRISCSCVRKTDVGIDPVPELPLPVLETCERSCRPGFIPQMYEGECICVLGGRNVMEGMLHANSHSGATQRPSHNSGGVPLPGFEHPPGHPQLHLPTTTTTTTTPRPPRPNRPTKRPRRPRPHRRNRVHNQ